jgi:ribosomal protein L44E
MFQFLKGMMKMGAVAMETRTVGRDRGYPIAEATLYIYCDKCGSFNIETYIPFIKLLTCAAVLTGAVFLALKDRDWLLCILPLGLLALFLPWRDILLRYQCRNCGNAQITDYNSLHYQSHDKTVVDVPDRLTQKRYIDEDVLHFQQFT